MSEKLHLWGETIEIRHSELLHVGEHDFLLHEVIASDDTQALIIICSEQIKKDTTDIRSFIEDALAARGLQGVFMKNDDCLFLESVSPLDDQIARRFKGQKAGIIALVNNREPGKGIHSLEEMILNKGEKLELLYRIGS